MSKKVGEELRDFDKVILHGFNHVLVKKYEGEVQYMKIVERIEGMTGKFNNQTVIITRGAIGIGESIAIEFPNLL